MMELESDLYIQGWNWNRTCIFKGGIGIELKGFGPESELNWNRLFQNCTPLDLSYGSSEGYEKTLRIIICDEIV